MEAFTVINPKERDFKKKVFAYFMLVALSASVLFLVPFSGKAAGEPRDFDDNAVVRGGAYTKEELIGKINAGSDLKQIMYNENRGISEQGIMNSSDGFVRKDGTVWAGGKQVASGVFSSGRSYITSSTKDGSLWMRPPSVSFLSSQLDAFVLMDGGTFKAAIVKSCGNPIKILAAPFPRVFKRVNNERLGPGFVAADTKETAISAKEGDNLKFDITVTNQGTTSATGVVVTDPIPNGINLKNTELGKNISIPMGSIPNQDRRNAIINVMVARGTAGQCIENIAFMTAEGGFKDQDSAWICVSKEVTIPKPPTPKQEQNIKIIKFEDIDHDGIQDSGEKVLPGFTFKLDNGATKVTDANGIVVFNDVSTGDHKIEEINIPSGWIAINRNPFNVDVPAGQTVARLFGNQKLPTPPTPPPKPPVPSVPPQPPAPTPPTPTPTPTPTPSVTPTQGGEVLGAAITKGGLPSAGPEDAFAGVFGTGALGYAGYIYFSAKKKFIKALLKK